jgi:hypothetical protein
MRRHWIIIIALWLSRSDGSILDGERGCRFALRDIELQRFFGPIRFGKTSLRSFFSRAALLCARRLEEKQVAISQQPEVLAW